MKLIGVMLILSGSFGIGFSAIQRLAGRVAALRTLTAALDVLEHELEFGLPSMTEWFENTASRSLEPASSFLRACIEKLNIQDGITLSEAWRTAAEQELSILKPCDIETIMSIGLVLGRYDAESQRSSISAARIQLAAQMEAALEERSRCGKVYGTLSAAVGFFLIIILI